MDHEVHIKEKSKSEFLRIYDEKIAEGYVCISNIWISLDNKKLIPIESGEFDEKDIVLYAVTVKKYDL